MARLKMLLLFVLSYAFGCAGEGQLESRFSELWVQGGNKSIVIGMEKFGTWRDYDFCRPGTYVYAMQLQAEGDQHEYWNGDPTGDDTGLNTMRLFCAPPGKQEPFTTVESHLGVWGQWGRKITCGKGVMIGAKSRAGGQRKNGRVNCRGIHRGFRCEHFQYDDWFGMTNVMMYCSDRNGYEGDGLHKGDWRPEKRCPKGYAVCGIRAMFQNPQPGFADDTALDAAELLCCPLKLVDCHPTDAWVTVMRCDNRRAGTETTCKHEQQIGTAVTRGEVKTERKDEVNSLSGTASAEYGNDALGFSVAFSETLGKSKSTGYDWTKGQDTTFTTVKTTTIPYSVPPHSYYELRQVIGTCGGATVATGEFTFVEVKKPLTDDTSNSNETTTANPVGTTTEEDEYRFYDSSRNWKKYGNHTLKGGKGGKGTWRKWEWCQEDMFAYQMIIKAEVDQGGGDDTAVNAFVLQCAPLGDGVSEQVPYGEIKSGESQWGGWGKFMDCKESVITGISVRSGGVRDRDEQRDCHGCGFFGTSTCCNTVKVHDDQTGVDNVKALCGNGKVLEGDGRQWGEYEPEQRCPAGYAICGLRVQIQDPLGDKDDTAVEAIEVACCRMFVDDCTPREYWDELLKINNTANIPLNKPAAYSQTVGSTITDTQVATKREKKQRIIEKTLSAEYGNDKFGLKAQFSLTIGKSTETGFDWTKSDVQTFSKSTTSAAEFTVPAHSTKSIEQLVGVCGTAQVRTTSFRFIDDVKETAEAVTAKSSDGQLVGGGKVTHEPRLRFTQKQGDVNKNLNQNHS